VLLLGAGNYKVNLKNNNHKHLGNGK